MAEISTHVYSSTLGFLMITDKPHFRTRRRSSRETFTRFLVKKEQIKVKKGSSQRSIPL